MSEPRYSLSMIILGLHVFKLELRLVYLSSFFINFTQMTRIHIVLVQRVELLFLKRIT